MVSTQCPPSGDRRLDSDVRTRDPASKSHHRRLSAVRNRPGPGIACHRWALKASGAFAARCRSASSSSSAFSDSSWR